MEEENGSEKQQEQEISKPRSPNCQEENFTHFLYLSCAGTVLGPNRQFEGNEALQSNLEEAIRASEPAGSWQISETSCGLIAAFVQEADVDRFLQSRNLMRVFDGPVQVARFTSRDFKYRQVVLLRDIPWAIPLQDLSSALSKQGITTGTIERSRQCVRVEVLDADHYELLLRQGLDFFGAARFSAVPERWWRTSTAGIVMSPVPNGGPGSNNFMESGNTHQGDGILQCYRCQGFWHVAANCRHLPRCVRCGEPHSVEFCPRPRNSPVCCHCSGSHHAGYRQCPVRLQLLNATPISITLNAMQDEGYTSNHGSKSNAASQKSQSLKPNQP